MRARSLPALNRRMRAGCSLLLISRFIHSEILLFVVKVALLYAPFWNSDNAKTQHVA